MIAITEMNIAYEIVSRTRRAKRKARSQPAQDPGPGESRARSSFASKGVGCGVAKHEERNYSKRESTHRRNCSYKFLGMNVMIVYSGD